MMLAHQKRARIGKIVYVFSPHLGHDIGHSQGRSRRPAKGMPKGETSISFLWGLCNDASDLDSLAQLLPDIQLGLRGGV
jgi:hypothetical protein